MRDVNKNEILPHISGIIRIKISRGFWPGLIYCSDLYFTTRWARAKGDKGSFFNRNGRPEKRSWSYRPPSHQWMKL